MAEFSGKIIDAFYANADYTMIKILYDPDGDPNTKELCPFYLEVDPNNKNYQEFIAEGWDQEKLLEHTAEFKRAQSAAFNIEVMTAAKELAREMIGMDVLQKEKEKLTGEVNKTKRELLDLDQTAKIRTKTVESELYQFIFDNNDSKEELFKAKLWALELELIKSADKDVKSSIRKATRITQVMGIIDNLLK